MTNPAGYGCRPRTASTGGTTGSQRTSRHACGSQPRGRPAEAASCPAGRRCAPATLFRRWSSRHPCCSNIEAQQRWGRFIIAPPPDRFAGLGHNSGHECSPGWLRQILRCLGREPDQEKDLGPSGPRIRCPLCGWSPRKEDRQWASTQWRPADSNWVYNAAHSGV